LAAFPDTILIHLPFFYFLLGSLQNKMYHWQAIHDIAKGLRKAFRIGSRIIDLFRAINDGDR
jgi:hypothetical protein